MVQSNTSPRGPDAEKGRATGLDRRAALIFWLQWVLANALGWAAGTAAALMRQGDIAPWITVLWIGGVEIPLFGSSDPPFVDVLSLVVMGTANGITQGLVLRWSLSRVSVLMLANILGFVAAGEVGVAVGYAVYKGFHLYPFSTPVYLDILFSLATGGCVIGMTQGVVLRWPVSRTALWVLTNVIGFIVGGLVWWATPFAITYAHLRVPMSVEIFGLVGSAMLGGGMGMVTGSALGWLLRHPAPKPKRV